MEGLGVRPGVFLGHRSPAIADVSIHDGKLRCPARVVRRPPAQGVNRPVLQPIAVRRAGFLAPAARQVPTVTPDAGFARVWAAREARIGRGQLGWTLPEAPSVSVPPLGA